MAAIADLNTYASTRFLNYNPGTNNITAAKITGHYNTSNIRDGIIRAVLDYRRSEFVHEGMRWFDILRYRLPVTHAIFGGQSITLSADDPRKVLQLPTTVSLSGLALNPR